MSDPWDDDPEVPVWVQALIVTVGAGLLLAVAIAMAAAMGWLHLSAAY